MKINAIDVFFCIIPIFYGFIMQFVSGLDNTAGDNVNFRPPGWLFSVVWSILFILLGFSWAIAARTSKNKILAIIIYACLVFLLGIWILVYAGLNKKTAASWLLILILAFSFASISLGNQWSKIMISPLIAWCIFAMIMNTTEVQET